MSTSQNNIAALIGSRICHDLISPLGAIGNGVELLGMSGAADGPEMALINESVLNANARVRFFRIAFGAAKSGAMTDQTEILSILHDINQSARATVNWDSENSMPRGQVKLAFLLIQCFETALPYGGVVEIKHRHSGWELSCTADKMKIEPAIWQMLVATEPSHGLTASQIQFALVPDAAHQAGCKLQTELGDNWIRLTF